MKNKIVNKLIGGFALGVALILGPALGIGISLAVVVYCLYIFQLLTGINMF